MDKYIEVINGASEGDRQKVLNLSREMGFLTGYESKVLFLFDKINYNYFLSFNIHVR